MKEPTEPVCLNIDTNAAERWEVTIGEDPGHTSEETLGPTPRSGADLEHGSYYVRSNLNEVVTEKVTEPTVVHPRHKGQASLPRNKHPSNKAETPKKSTL